jgi:hypothetical protein
MGIQSRTLKLLIFQAVAADASDVAPPSSDAAIDQQARRAAGLFDVA